MDPDTSQLFDCHKLEQLSKWQEIKEALAVKGYMARPLRRDDHSAGYMDLLAQLTEVGSVSREQFERRFDLMKSINRVTDHYYIVVIEEKSTGKIVGASTLFLELKFIHECAIRGRLEEVVIHKEHRSKNVGELIVKIIVELAREVHHCYKLTLDCTDELKKFYNKNGFNYGSNMMCNKFEQ